MKNKPGEIETAEALFEVDDYQKYVAVQSESAVRAVAQSYPYDSHSDNEQALSTHVNEVSAALQQAVLRGYPVSWLDEYPRAIAALTLEDVNHAIKTHINPAKLVLVKAGTV